MTGNEQATEKTSTTKLMAIFFPLKPLKNKFSENFIAIQVADFIPKLDKYCDKAIVYKIDKERFYTFDFKTEKFDDKFEVVDNETVVVIFSVDKSFNVDVSDMFEADFVKNINTIRIHRKRVDAGDAIQPGNAKPSYIFYTINSTRLLNALVPIIQKDADPEGKGKTYFILGANNAKRDINPLEKSFSTEKLCRMNYVTTIDLKANRDENFTKNLKRKVHNQIKF